MVKSIPQTVFFLLVVGAILALFKLIYLFLDFYNVLDLVVFAIAGFAFGHKVPSANKALGLLLALPAFVLCLFFVINLGYSSITKGVGTAYAISLFAIPAATLLGIYLRQRRDRKKAAQPFSG